MAKTPSIMAALGTKAPEFTLEDVISGLPVTRPRPGEYAACVIMFICNHCPYVKHVNTELTRLASDYQSRGVRFIAISSNDVEHYPDDSPVNMRATAEKEAYPFPYLFDSSQAVAKAYQAACTPDFFVYSGDLSLVYRGQLDNSRPGNNIPVTGSSIRHALDCLLAGEPVSGDQIPSLGCNIKWKPLMSEQS